MAVTEREELDRSIAMADAAVADAQAEIDRLTERLNALRTKLRQAQHRAEQFHKLKEKS